MVRNFKGVVKVADVQEEFDNLLNTINEAIDRYNNSLNIEDIDYNNASSELAPLGYTLSVGGLKSIIKAYDGALLGGQLLRITNGSYIVSEGLYIKNGQVKRLASKPVGGSGNILYYDEENEVYSFSTTSSESGYYQEIIDTVTSPSINGSDSSELGSLSSSAEATYDGRNNFYPYMAFPNNSVKRFTDLELNGTEYSITWNFLNPTELQNISFRYGIWGGGNMQILDLNGNVLLSDSVSGAGTNATKDFNGVFNTGETKYNGIRIRLYGFNSAYMMDAVLNFAKFTLGNISLTGKTTTKVYIPASAGDPENFIPICMVNANRISRLCNTQNAINEEIPNYVMTIPDKSAVFTNESLSNSKHGQFIGGVAGRNCSLKLFGYNVTTSPPHGASNARDAYWEPFNYLFIPKGISNPYTDLTGETVFAYQKVWDYKLERPER